MENEKRKMRSCRDEWIHHDYRPPNMEPLTDEQREIASGLYEDAIRISMSFRKKYKNTMKRRMALDIAANSVMLGVRHYDPDLGKATINTYLYTTVHNAHRRWWKGWQIRKQGVLTYPMTDVSGRDVVIDNYDEMRAAEWERPMHERYREVLEPIYAKYVNAGVRGDETKWMQWRRLRGVYNGTLKKLQLGVSRQRVAQITDKFAEWVRTHCAEELWDFPTQDLPIRRETVWDRRTAQNHIWKRPH